MVWVIGPMTWMILIALGLIPWVVAVRHVLRRQNPASRAKSAAKREFDDALRRMLSAEETGVFQPASARAGISAQPVDVIEKTIGAEQPQNTPVAPEPVVKEDMMPEAIRQLQMQGQSLPAGLSIIEGFVPGDDLLELTLDEDEVAAAEAAGLKLDVRVERASAGQGSLVTVGGTPLAFIRGNAQVTPRDVILRVEKAA